MIHDLSQFILRSFIVPLFWIEYDIILRSDSWNKLDLTRALQELYALSQTKMQGILGSSKFDLNKFCLRLSQACNFLRQHVSLHVGETCLSWLTCRLRAFHVRFILTDGISNVAV